MSRFRLSALLVLSAGVIAVLLVRRGNSYMAAPASEPVATKDPEPEVVAEPVALEPELEPEPVVMPEPESVVIVEPESELIMAVEQEPEPEPQLEPESDPGYWAVPSAPPADWSDERRSA